MPDVPAERILRRTLRDPESHDAPARRFTPAPIQGHHHNFTYSFDNETLRILRAEARRRGTSASGILRDLLYSLVDRGHYTITRDARDYGRRPPRRDGDQE